MWNPPHNKTLEMTHRMGAFVIREVRIQWPVQVGQMHLINHVLRNSLFQMIEVVTP
jgi:hypothetical protein